ncbi:hypothetical protein [Brevundimonas sp. Root1279]|uniref:hypothetical protein n=1 Tax=Brevundimonas sp. Root1279 TaxID=1736443 RepID=UPI0006F39347|nr:hypothetical protein [Brevundimonas sp. Root1279]KQW78837.1 hypothetical protein ASC65_16140 [Brevundimonas sp. Root1279]
MKSVAAFAAVACAFAGPAKAEEASAAKAAEYILHNGCLPLFEGGAVTEDRVREVATGINLREHEGKWYALIRGGTSLALSWNPEPGVCQIAISGAVGTANDLLDEMTAIGWGEQQRNVWSPDGSLSDLWCGGTSKMEGEVCVAVWRTTNLAQATDGVVMTINVIKAP